MKDSRRRAITPFERMELNLSALRARMDERQPLDHWEYRQGRHLAPGKTSFDGPWQPYRAGTAWGGDDVSAWFRCRAVVPASFDGRHVLLHIYPGGEGILRLNGQPVFGFDFHHRDYPLGANARAGDAFEVELECYVRDAPDDAIRNDVRLFHVLETAELVARDRELEALAYDMASALDLARAAQADDPALCERLLDMLRRTVALLEPHTTDPGRYRESAREARCLLQSELYPANQPAKHGELNLVGHCHIDLVYTWPYRESVRKNLRTTLIVLHLMDRYPDFVFTQSQAKLYADLQRYHPGVFELVKQRVAEGRFEPVGGMWVEADGNIPCGEAWVRQFLYGRAFFDAAFGQRSAVCWMPDVFGVGAALPQILLQAGFRLFYTNKQAIWNDTNPFPHNTFWWEGLDGSRILAHIPPMHFVGKMDPQSLRQQWSEHAEKVQAPAMLYTYGFGDGGGGPTAPMLEAAERLARMDGLPVMRMSTAADFARRLEAGARELPVWADELYLEMHRGAQTSKGDLKRLNRQAESALICTEALATVADRLYGAPAPTRELEDTWKMLLECHFHDAVTGTHCSEAGAEVKQAYVEILERTQQMDATSYRALLTPTSHPDGQTLLHLSGGATEGHLIWRSDQPSTLASGGEILRTQPLADGALLTHVPAMPAFGHRVLRRVPLTGEGAAPFTMDERRLCSPHYELDFDEQGCLCRLLDRDHARDVVRGPANRFRLYEDKPGRFEAWDIAVDYAQRPMEPIRFLGAEDGANGELMASRWFRWSLGGGSQITQEIRVYAHSRRIDFCTRILWREDQKLLRVDFPLALHAAEATYEVAFGAIRRSTRPSNSYDKAKFEVPFHRWFDVAEFGYGVALLNTGKYGGCVRDHVASISLLKAPRYPDPQSDRCEHEFTYSLLPHEGDWQSAGVFQEAALLNTPARLIQGEAREPWLEYVRVSTVGLAVAALKRAEDGDGWILRLVDTFGQTRHTIVCLPFPVASVSACTILEEPMDADLTLSGEQFAFTCRPFGIHSFRIR